jgi:hypothetical protein
MKYIKTFESRKDEILRGKDITQIEQDINGMLIELSDIGIQYRSVWVGNWTNGIIIYLDRKVEERLHNAMFNNARMSRIDYEFNTSDVKEYLLTIEDYFKEYWGDISIRYDLIGNNFDKTLDNLDYSYDVLKIALEIKRK